MGRKRFHQLKKIKVRATWNKYNLYNLSRLQQPSNNFMTFYQQKWKSKSITRAYHGEQIREKQWQRMFTPRLNAVVPMDHRYLAQFDGSELAAGRGSGLDQPLNDKGKARLTPYMLQTYAPIERRLDMSVWRALFASSARQARQFVVHGKVKVNGKKMIYPGYLLNPGDLFQVEPEAVLFATGAPKDTSQKRAGRHVHRATRNKNVSMEKLRVQTAERRAAQVAKTASKKDASEVVVTSKVPKAILQDNLEYRKTRQEHIDLLIQKAEKKQNDKNKIASAKKKQQIRAFVKHAKAVRAQVYRKPMQDLEKDRFALLDEYREAVETSKDSREQRLEEIRKKQERKESKGLTTKAKSQDAEESVPEKTKVPYGERVAQEQLKNLERRLAEQRLEIVDPAKPYATPWRPRDYMSAFAFIPRYLEVNSKICSAVYLRHPVARPGLTEVPSPFGNETHQLAFTWYLRRR